MRPGQTVAKTASPLFAVAWGCVAACTSAKGGAVDLSWRLKPQAGFSESSTISDSFVDCNKNGELTDSTGTPILGVGAITSIRLFWQVGGQSGSVDAASGGQDFQCSTENGVTGFQVPTGNALLSVVPVCQGSAAADSCTYVAPAPVERTIVEGQTVQLGALEIVVDVGTGSANLNSCMSMEQTTCICTMKGCPP
jgi:hypothetical protein